LDPYGNYAAPNGNYARNGNYAARNGNYAAPNGNYAAPSLRAMFDRIRNATFRTTRLRPGYDEDEVDAFLDYILETLRRGQRPYKLQVRCVEFSTTRLRPGYEMEDVDNLLNWIERYVGG
jgi:DivIVA domain-containing protein